MAGVGSEIVYVICPIEEIMTNKKTKEIKLKETIAAICALLNSNGGSVVLVIDNMSIAGKCLPSSQALLSTVIRIVEQTMISIIGIQLTVSNVHFQEDKGSVVILVMKADSLITTSYNLYLPSYTQVVLVPATEPPEKIVDITNRKIILQAVAPGTHWKLFVKNKNFHYQETNVIQFKCVKSDASKRTTLGDRITGKGNKFSCYVSAFANHNGGHLYYGINDEGVVEGQFISSEDAKRDVTKRVEKAINKMTWPKQIAPPRRGEHWEISFEPVVDENSKPIPSTFVIVIYIAPCLGGVFTEEPECYEMVERKVEKMSFDTWKKRILQPVRLQNKEEIPHSVGRITWSSTYNREALTFAHRVLMPLINNGNWKDISKECDCLVDKYPRVPKSQIDLLVLSKRITMNYRRGDFNKAQALLQKYTSILPQVQDQFFFEVLQLYLNAALKRASGDFVGLKEFLSAALSKAELIELGLVQAIVYVFAATVTDLVKSEDQKEMISPQYLSINALQCLKSVPDPYNVLTVMMQKSHITLATFYLRGNISGQRFKGHEEVRLDEAKKSIMAVQGSKYDGNLLEKYIEVQLNLVESMYFYRYSQKAADRRARYLAEAFNHARKAENLASDCQFTELVEWSKNHQAWCTEE